MLGGLALFACEVIVTALVSFGLGAHEAYPTTSRVLCSSLCMRQQQRALFQLLSLFSSGKDQPLVSTVPSPATQAQPSSTPQTATQATGTSDEQPTSPESEQHTLGTCTYNVLV